MLTAAFYLTPAQILMLCQILKERLQIIIKTVIYYYEVVVALLTKEQGSAVYEAMKDILFDDQYSC